MGGFRGGESGTSRWRVLSLRENKCHALLQRVESPTERWFREPPLGFRAPHPSPPTGQNRGLHPDLAFRRRRNFPRTSHAHCLQLNCPPTVSGSFHRLYGLLFTFPSRYLFAIGLSSVFSLGWNLPPAWCCNPKQHDSWRTSGYAFASSGTAHGAITLWGRDSTRTWSPPRAASGATSGYNSRL